VDVEESEDAYILKAEMPGLRKEDVKISLSDNVLTLTGEKKSEERSKDKRYHRVERSYGAFQRSFALSAPIQADKVSASFKEGILTVTVPKSEEAKPREIDIRVE
jgi:HSP20 family protein